MEEDAEDEDLGAPLLNQIFEIWVEPELTHRGLQLSRDQISKVVIEMDPSQARPIIKINEEATIIAEAKATRAIEAGEPVTRTTLTRSAWCDRPRSALTAVGPASQ
jgi:hypothetical protein